MYAHAVSLLPNPNHLHEFMVLSTDQWTMPMTFQSMNSDNLMAIDFAHFIGRRTQLSYFIIPDESHPFYNSPADEVYARVQCFGLIGDHLLTTAIDILSKGFVLPPSITLLGVTLFTTEPVAQAHILATRARLASAAISRSNTSTARQIDKAFHGA